MAEDERPSARQAREKKFPSLPQKLEFIRERTKKSYNEFCEGLPKPPDKDGKSEGHVKKSTVLSWFGKIEKGGELPAIDKPAIPDGDHFKVLSVHVAGLLEIEKFPDELWGMEFKSFTDEVERLLASKPAKRLILPLSRRLGRMPENISKVLCGKYVLYRYSMRYAGSLISEIFTLSPSQEDGCLEMTLRSAPEQDNNYEVYTGRFFRYGKMYWGIVSFSLIVGQEKRDLMRVMHFPEVDIPRGFYMALITGDAYTTVRAVAVRGFTKRFSEDTQFTAEDDKQVWIVDENKSPKDAPLIPIDVVKSVLASGLEGAPPLVSTYHVEKEIPASLKDQ